MKGYEQALAIHREVRNRRSEGIVQGFLSQSLVGQGKFEEALKHSLESLTIHREVSNRRFEAVELITIGAIYKELDRMREAEECLLASLSIARELETPGDQARTMAGLGSLYDKWGRPEDAKRNFDDAVATRRAMDDRLGLVHDLCHLVEFESRQGNRDAALATLAEVEAMADSSGETRDSGMTQRLERLRREIPGG